MEDRQVWTLLEWLWSFAWEYSFTIFLVGGSALFLWLLVRAKGLRIPVPHLPGSANLIGALGYWKHFKPLVPPKEVWLMVLVSFSLYVALRLGFPGGKEYWWWLVPLWAGTFSLVIISLHASKLASIVFVPALLITALGIMLPNLPAYGPSGPPLRTNRQMLGMNCNEQVQRVTLTSNINDPVNHLNYQGNCFMRGEQATPTDCIGIFDRWKIFLAEDCGGAVLTLQGKSPAFFISTKKPTADYVFVLCKEKGRTGLIADGCP